MNAIARQAQDPQLTFGTAFTPLRTLQPSSDSTLLAFASPATLETGQVEVSDIQLPVFEPGLGAELQALMNQGQVQQHNPPLTPRATANVARIFGEDPELAVFNRPADDTTPPEQQAVKTERVARFMEGVQSLDPMEQAFSLLIGNLAARQNPDGSFSNAGNGVFGKPLHTTLQQLTGKAFDLNDANATIDALSEYLVTAFGEGKTIPEILAALGLPNSRHTLQQIAEGPLMQAVFGNTTVEAPVVSSNSQPDVSEEPVATGPSQQPIAPFRPSATGAQLASYSPEPLTPTVASDVTTPAPIPAAAQSEEQPVLTALGSLIETAPGLSDFSFASPSTSQSWEQVLAGSVSSGQSFDAGRQRSYGPGYHNGIDFDSTEGLGPGAQVRSMFSNGVVESTTAWGATAAVDVNGESSNAIRVRYELPGGGNFYVEYGHLLNSPDKLHVAVGDTIDAGTPIGQNAQDDSWSQGGHLDVKIEIPTELAQRSFQNHRSSGNGYSFVDVKEFMRWYQQQVSPPPQQPVVAGA